MRQDLNHITVSEEISLSPVQEADKALYVEYLKDREIYENTLRIPFPYTPADAEAWIHLNQQHQDKGDFHNWAIRDHKGLLLGGAGFVDQFEIGKTHKAEIGYWLAKRFWGKGLMTSVVSKISEVGFRQMQLVRMTATVFAPNIASSRVLKKCGYLCEGRLQKYYLKDGQYIDAKLYALVSSS